MIAGAAVAGDDGEGAIALSYHQTRERLRRMAVEYAPKGLIGVLTPQANTTVEPEFWIMLPPGVAMINARMTSDKIVA